jgi:hypothetical protein
MNFGLFPNGPLLVFETAVVPHVIGLPDCYHEFYDTNLEAYVNYQLDISDLMCSRAGNIKERIYTELKKVYGTK